jgi:TetR/AcrR family fatty acid metabolism transcriptional regulator
MVRIVESLERALVGARTPEEKLRRFVEHHLTLVEQDRALAEVITVELRQSTKFMKEYKNPRFAEYLKITADIFDEGKAAGDFRTDATPWLLARALFGMLDELSLTWVLGRTFDIRAAAREIVDVLMNGLYRRSPGGPGGMDEASPLQGGSSEDSGDGETGHRP